MTAHQPNQDLAWTVERIATLTRLWAAGASQGEIAALFGVTRNTIAGKISRLKLTRTPSQRAPRKSRAGRPQRPKNLNNALAWIDRPKPAPLPPEPAPSMGGVQLVDLTNATCRWPFGSVSADDFHFCGVPTADLNGGSQRRQAVLPRAHQTGEAHMSNERISDTSTDRQADDPQTLVLNENEKATLRRIAYARASGIKLDPFWLDFEAALTVSVASPDRNSK